jgi:5-methylcytosine-specific restriction endonuclease McrA
MSFGSRAGYLNAIASPHWRELRDEVVVMRQRYCCALCGQVYGDLELHHLNYDRLGRELPEDVQALCWECHRHADRERARRGYWRRVDGWASQVFGEDWGAME